MFYIFLQEANICRRILHFFYKNYSWSSWFDSLPHIFICLYIFIRKEDELSLLNTKKTKILSKYSNPMRRTRNRCELCRKFKRVFWQSPSVLVWLLQYGVRSRHPILFISIFRRNLYKHYSTWM